MNLVVICGYHSEDSDILRFFEGNTKDLSSSYVVVQDSSKFEDLNKRLSENHFNVNTTLDKLIRAIS